MKYTFSLILFFTHFLMVSAQGITINVTPEPLYENQMGQINISLEGQTKITDIQFPTLENVTFYPNVQSQQTQIINGAVSHSVGYGILVSAATDVTIPPFKIQTSQGEKITTSYTFSVVKRDLNLQSEKGESLSLSDVTFIRAHLSDKRKKYYVGEMIPFKIELGSKSTLPFQVQQYPSIGTVQNLIFTQYQLPQSGETILVNSEITRSNEHIDKVNYHVVIFNGSFRPLQAGIYNIPIHAQLMLVQRSQSFSFFDEPSSIPCPLKSEIKNIQIVPLPPAPKEAIDLALMSETPPHLEFNSSNAKVGEALTLELNLYGAVSSVQTPDLSLEHFRVFPPEKNLVSSSHMRIRYLIVPLNEGEQTLSLKFATFNPVHGTWLVTPFERTFKVLKATYTMTSHDINPTLPQAENKTEIFDSDILYIKPLSADVLMLKTPRPPNWKSAINQGGIIVLIGFLGYLVAQILFIVKIRQNTDPNYLRYKTALKNKSKLIKKFLYMTKEQFNNAIRIDLVDFLVDIKKLPQGTSLSDLKNEVKNKELAHMLEEVESATYQHTQVCDDFEKKSKIIINILKKSLWIFLFFCSLTTFAMPPDTSLVQAITTAEKAYEKGDFQTAYNAYKQVVQRAPNHGDAWFDLANTAYQLKNYPQALLFYERAYRFEPSNNDYLANLNATRTQLGLQQRGEIKHPMDFLSLLRDRLTCTSWIIFSSCGISFALLMSAWGLWSSRNKIYLGVGIGFVILLIGISMSVWQEKTLYNPHEALITVKQATVWSLPMAETAKKIAQLFGGQTVEVLQNRNQFCHVRYIGGEGWVKASDLAIIWE